MFRLILLTLALLIPVLPAQSLGAACAPLAASPMMSSMTGAKCCAQTKPFVAIGCSTTAEKPAPTGPAATCACACEAGSAPMAPAPTPATLRVTQPALTAMLPRIDALTDALIARARPMPAAQPGSLIGAQSNQDRRALVGVWRT